ncbi:hypothetical protein A2697_03235 [Candidatus Curtissbacteria bacterium RIFCSPHIGHO2_01_FULL_41_44]|uniref:DUF2283 domain-containing protein n=1 Tax=Candidatus Curtissbacteria bacterium RIFCSPLOWO2_01_FULL_42_50 TaxID=1797730 RepID=A0A1F5H4E8_9BACT|nr:MAG: hypothetical protein A2697_03235 [Candidatus Curtissbacteria bacterium RIFCSPHIGHO2_01_FULL_41_44]OGD93546.1 MAG: hypothetical protein A3C33_00875 [Candidatus Curtissbacteria bacterium RIFCSPHIGHO2_02_FULL_42_58]OGD97854.1 MAG: hypothetical protein A3E71_04770 [Candidatus Curtissbacteria bacterium RIFCSPHIGHO2_12_FULL_42_33]OGD99052.1 MAG: hypothetical protein A3B54_04690 [Candidatus Curtissbacteria bacterium RIFCSPLOWO2_01_FULL_42_50]OGE03404.1 MAG: hypothetical protein A3G16_01610 [Ca
MSKTKIHYDKKSDILYIVLKSGPEEYAEEVTPYVTVEYDEANKPIGIEIFKASKILGEKLIKKDIPRTTPISA